MKTKILHLKKLLRKRKLEAAADVDALIKEIINRPKKEKDKSRKVKLKEKR